MADPSIQTFCCQRAPGVSKSVDFLSEFNSDSYNTVCLASSTIGIVGAIYQILPKENYASSSRLLTVSTSRGRHIIVWLAFADLLASIGVFIRSIVWLFFQEHTFFMESSSLTIVCAVSAAWIQYFYTATWLWTLVYAIDMRLVLQEKEGYPYRYHLIVWSVPSVLTALGLSILYVPNANCHNTDSLSNALFRILPNYFATYIPMAGVMLINPLLYFNLSSQVESLVARSVSQFTGKERQVVDLLRVKFLLINIAFYACWLPNLINGILIWALWFNLPQNVLLALWYVMALMNPLQALFNSFVYRRWSGGSERVHLPCRVLTSFNSRSSSTASCPKEVEVMPNESTPLIGSSINCSSNSSDDDEKYYDL